MICWAALALAGAPTTSVLAEGTAILLSGPYPALLAGRADPSAFSLPPTPSAVLVSPEGPRTSWTVEDLQAAWGPDALVHLTVAFDVAHGSRPDKKDLAARITTTCATSDPATLATGLRVWRARGGRGAPPCAAAALSHPDPRARAAAVSLLAETDERLVHATTDPDPAVRREAWQALGPQAGPLAHHTLAAAATPGPASGLALVEAIAAVRDAPSAETGTLLVSVGLVAGSVDVFAAALDALAVLGDVRSHDLLVRTVIVQRGPDVALPRAIDLAGQSPNPDVVGTLVALAADRRAPAAWRARALVGLRATVPREAAQLAVLDGLQASPRTADTEALLTVGLTALTWIDREEGARAVAYAIDVRFSDGWAADPLLTRHLPALLLQVAPEDPRVDRLRAAGALARFGLE